MMRIECPCCGVRDETEFAFGGESHLPRPPLTATDREWTHYLYFRLNPRGVHYERWMHARGCRLWFNVARDTVSHRILAVYPIGAPRPQSFETAS